MLRRNLMLALVAVLAIVAPRLLADEADKPASVNLLEGNDLSKHWTTKGNWKIDDEGVVTLTPRPGESGWQRYDAYLWSNREYDDFVIEFEYKVEPRGNSGFYFNVGDRANPVAKGIEVQIYDTDPNKEMLTDHDSGGIIPGIPPTKAAAKPAGEWNRFEIAVKGETVTVKLNGQQVNEVNLKQPRLEGRPDRGYVGFQDHGLPFALRKITIREL
jgi:hypothetical protein